MLETELRAWAGHRILYLWPAAQSLNLIPSFFLYLRNFFLAPIEMILWLLFLDLILVLFVLKKCWIFRIEVSKCGRYLFQASAYFPLIILRLHIYKNKIRSELKIFYIF